eukprot:363835-Chlamydomonas_euryale.AAC.5
MGLLLELGRRPSSLARGAAIYLVDCAAVMLNAPNASVRSSVGSLNGRALVASSKYKLYHWWGLTKTFLRSCGTARACVTYMCTAWCRIPGPKLGLF